MVRTPAMGVMAPGYGAAAPSAPSIGVTGAGPVAGTAGAASVTGVTGAGSLAASAVVAGEKPCCSNHEANVPAPVSHHKASPEANVSPPANDHTATRVTGTKGPRR